MPNLVKVPETEDIYRHPAHGTYYLRIYSAYLGEKYRTLGTRSLREAQRRAREARDKVARLDPHYRPRTWGEIAQAAFEVRQKGNTGETMAGAKYIYERLKSAFGDLPVELVTDELWLEQLAAWKAGTDRTTFANFRKYALQVDRFAVAKGFKRFRCDFPIDDPRPREGVVLTPGQLDLLLDGCRHHYAAGVRLRPRVGRDLEQGLRSELFFALCLHHGMRRREASELTWARVNFIAQSITLRPEDTKTGRKTGRGRVFGIAPAALPLLAAARARASTPWVFPNRAETNFVEKKSWNRIAGRLGKKVGVDFRPHDLRHTFLTRKLLVEKIDPFSVAVYAGVSLSVIEKVYLHPTVDDTRHVVNGSVGKVSESESKQC